MAREGREVWEKRVGRWNDSGLTADEFAAEMGFRAGTLRHWKWKLGREASGRPYRERRRRGRTGVTAPSFVELTLPVAAPDDRFELETGRWRLRVPVRFDAEALGRLLAVVGAKA
jgi:transposase